MENENHTLNTTTNEGTMTSDSNAKEPEDFIVQDEEDIQNDTTLGEAFFDNSDSEDDIANRYDVHNLITRIVVHKRIRMGLVKKSLLQSKQMSQVPKNLYDQVLKVKMLQIWLFNMQYLLLEEKTIHLLPQIQIMTIYMIWWFFKMIVLTMKHLERDGLKDHELMEHCMKKKNINKYREDIKKMFMRGKRDLEKKMIPAIMLENLKRKYMNLFSLPSETEI